MNFHFNWAVYLPFAMRLLRIVRISSTRANRCLTFNILSVGKSQLEWYFPGKYFEICCWCTIKISPFKFKSLICESLINFEHLYQKTKKDNSVNTVLDCGVKCVKNEVHLTHKNRLAQPFLPSLSYNFNVSLQNSVCFSNLRELHAYHKKNQISCRQKSYFRQLSVGCQ